MSCTSQGRRRSRRPRLTVWRFGGLAVSGQSHLHGPAQKEAAAVHTTPPSRPRPRRSTVDGPRWVQTRGRSCCVLAIGIIVPPIQSCPFALSSHGLRHLPVPTLQSASTTSSQGHPREGLSPARDIGPQNIRISEYPAARGCERPLPLPALVGLPRWVGLTSPFPTPSRD
jgi:hypothetical protein